MSTSASIKDITSYESRMVEVIGDAARRKLQAAERSGNYHQQVRSREFFRRLMESRTKRETFGLVAELLSECGDEGFDAELCDEMISRGFGGRDLKDLALLGVGLARS